MSEFYKEGLRFSCQGCGKCCQLPNGCIYISRKEAWEISQYLKLEYEDFLSDYCSKNDTILKLKESSQVSCIFLSGDRCQIYKVRPLQCQTFPFWPENLKSRFRWKQLKVFCSGVDIGELYLPDRIKEISQLQKKHDSAFENESEDI
jgi:Fe-S-cluster containining protein